MNNIKAIRTRLGLTQTAFGEGLGCTQGNVGHYEKGQTVLPDVAGKVIEFAKTKGLTITFDHVYGDVPLPEVAGLTQEAA